MRQESFVQAEQKVKTEVMSLFAIDWHSITNLPGNPRPRI